MMETSKTDVITTGTEQVTSTATTSTLDSNSVSEAVPSLSAGPKPSVGLMGLAEVAFAVEAQASPQPPMVEMEVDRDNNNIIDKSFSLKQIRKMPDKKLLSTFAEYCKRGKHLSYKCQFKTTDGQPCQQVFDTDGGDRVSIARLMTTHLKSQLATLEKVSPDIKIETKLKLKKRPLKKKIITKAPATQTSSLVVDSLVAGATSSATDTTRPVSPLPSMMVMTTPTTPVHEKKGSTATAITVVLAKKTPVKGNGSDKSEATKTSVAGAPLVIQPTLQQPVPVTKPINIVAAAMDAANIFGTQDDNNTNKPITTPFSSNNNEIVVSSTIIVQRPPQTFGAMIPGQPIKENPIDVKPPQVVANHSIRFPGMTAPIMAAPVVIEDSSSDLKNEPSSSGGTVSYPSSSKTIATPAIEDPVDEDPEVAKVRAQALEYIDDIRKKSSSAAKSVIVNGDKSLIYECKLCPDKQFTSTNGLIFHYKKHAGLKPYICELCSATFTRQHSLNYHMLIHYNKSRFVCKECGRHFRHPSHFKEHMRRHTGETPFQCSDCLIRFKTRNTYKRHLQTKHAKILTSKGIVQLTGSDVGLVGQAAIAAAQRTTAAAAAAAKATSTNIVYPATTSAINTKTYSKAKGPSKKNIKIIEPRQQVTMAQIYQQQPQVMQQTPNTATATQSIQQHSTLIHYDPSNTVYINDSNLLNQFLPSMTSSDGQSIAFVNVPMCQTSTGGTIGTTTTGQQQQTVGNNNFSRVQKPLGDLNENVYNQPQTYTIVPYPTGIANTSTTTLVNDPNAVATSGLGHIICGADGNMVVEPIKTIHMDASGLMMSTTTTSDVAGGSTQQHTLQPTLLTMTSGTDENNANQLTQLTTAISPQMTVVSAGQSYGQTQQVVVATAAGNTQVAQTSQITMTNGQPAATNYNFMRLLEAIEMTEVVQH